MPHKDSSTHVAWTCLAILALLDACSFDESKLRRHALADAAGPEVAATPADASATGPDVVAAGDDTRADVPAVSSPDGSPEVNGAGLADGAAAGGVDGGLGGAGGSGLGGSSGADGSADRAQGSGGQGSGEEAGSPLLLDTAGPVDDGARDQLGTGSDPADAPPAEDSNADDRGGQTIDAPAGADVVDAALGADSRPASDARADTLSVDARGKRICPTSISGSLDSSDATQVGRLSRVYAASVCATSKDFPGNGADRTNSHLYDVYHFINVASAPVCFTFTLTYSSSQELFVAAYSTFDPTDITTGFLGDVGDTLTPPQIMGITVGPGETIDVVVFAVAIGTDPAGAYTLGCSAQ